MSSINFNIVERTPTVIDYECFKKDFLNPNISVDNLRELYNLTRAEYRHYRDRILEETGLSRKPAKYGRDTQITGDEFIQNRYNGFAVVKTTDNVTKWYGRYKDLETARYVRDKLVESGWDDIVGYKLKEKYALKRMKPSESKAEQCYSEFKELYFDSEYTIAEIREIMGLTHRVYLSLLAMIKKEYGRLYRKR